MRAFVTGGTGLIGHSLVESLLSRGWEVTILTRDPRRAGDLADRGVRVVRGDVTRPDFGQELADIDVLFHCAAWFEVGVRDGRAMLDVNVTGTANVLAMARKQRVPRIVYTSTAGLLLGTREHPATEVSTPVAAIDDPYVVSKLQAHRLVENEMHSGLPITIVMPGGVFGPRDTNQLGRSLALLVQGRLKVVPSGFGTNTFVHAADVAEGHILAATVGRSGELYLLGDRVLSLSGFLEAAAHAAGVDPPRRRVPMVLARFAARFSELRARLHGSTAMINRAALDLATLDVVVDSSKARQELGWTPGVFEDRLKETMAWFVATYGRRGARLPVKSGGASGADRTRPV